VNSVARSAILPLRALDTEINIFSNKSSLIFFWLLVHQDQAKKDALPMSEPEKYRSQHRPCTQSNYLSQQFL